MIISASVEAERMMASERVRRSGQLFFCKVFMLSRIDREKKIIAFDTKYGWQVFLWGFLLFLSWKQIMKKIYFSKDKLATVLNKILVKCWCTLSKTSLYPNTNFALLMHTFPLPP